MPKKIKQIFKKNSQQAPAPGVPISQKEYDLLKKQAKTKGTKRKKAQKDAHRPKK